MITLKIKNLQALTILGVHAWEKEAKRRVVLNIALEVEDGSAGESDDIKHAVDYSRIEERVVARLDESPYNLIERLVADIAQLILSLDARIASVTLEADKPGALRQAESVAVQMTLKRSAP